MVLSTRSDPNDLEEQVEVVNILFETFFAAAAEVAVTLGTVLYCLLINRDAYNRLVNELRGQTGSRTESLDVHRTWKNTFLAATIKESLRLYSSNSPPMERVVPSKGLQANGYTIPPKTIVSIPQYAVQRDVDVYGLDAKHFRPERWLEADETTLKKMDRNFLAFGRGSRACVGRDLALLEIKMFVADVLQRFDIKSAAQSDLPKITMFWMLDHVNFRVQMKGLPK